MLDKVGLGLARQIAEQESLRRRRLAAISRLLTSHCANPKIFLDLSGSARSALDTKNIPGPKEPDSKFRQLEK